MAGPKKWTFIDFIIISGLLFLAAVSINWFAGLGYEPLDKYGAMMFETSGSQYTEGYASYGIDTKNASKKCRSAMQAAADRKMRIRGALSEAEAADDTAKVAQLTQTIEEIDNSVIAACR